MVDKIGSRIRSLWIATALLATVFLLLPALTLAHDIPSDVTVQAFVKPEGQSLRLLVRVPMSALRDIDFPRRGPGYLDLALADSALRDAAIVWIVNNLELYEEDNQLHSPRLFSVLVSLPSDRSFLSYQEAVAHVTGPPLPPDTNLYWNQGMLDALIEYSIQSDQSRFSIHPAFERLGLRVVTVVRFLPPSGVVRAFEFTGDPGLVKLDPRWLQAALRFVELGFLHILGGIDHLLFLFCLVIPLRRLKPIILVVTAFTVAHSITLIASAYNLAPNALWFPPLVETLIAASIFYMALENIVVGSREIVVRRRWTIAFGFGLVHGFGFSFALRESLQLAGSHLLTSLVSFNVGIEIGQLLVLLLMIPVLYLLFRFVMAERMGIIILSAIIAHTAWHWMIERGGRLREFPWPVINAAFLASVMRWMMVALIGGGVVWVVSRVVRERFGRSKVAGDDSSADKKVHGVELG
jgi:hypothetical protein